MNRDFIKKYVNKHGLRCHDCHLGQAYDCVKDKGDKNALTISQTVVHALARAHSRGRLDAYVQGLLVWHGTGSGKTCASTAIMDAFWDTDYDIYFVTSPANINSNPPHNFHLCAKMFPRFAQTSIENIAIFFKKRRVAFMTYAQLAHALAVHRPRKNTINSEQLLVIIDEAHVLVKPLQTQKHEADALVSYFRGGHSNPISRKLKLFMLTATPGETVDDVLHMLELTLPPGHKNLMFPTDADSAMHFMQRIKYSVTFYDPRNDYDIYPSVMFNDVMVPVSLVQFSRYQEALKATDPAAKNYTKLKDENRLNVYYASGRRFANALFKKKENMSWSDFSAKVMALLGKIIQFEKQKHLIYSAFYENRAEQSQGLFLIAHMLEIIGFERIDTSTLNDSLLSHPNTFMMKKRRYCVITAGAIGKNPAQRPARLNALLTIFNSHANRNGEYVQAMLISQNYFESLDLKAVRHVHVFDPMLTDHASNQLVGRAARRCSHAQLSPQKQDWNVTVHRYSIAPPSMGSLKRMFHEIQDELAELDIVGTRDSALAAHVRGLQQQLKDVTDAISTYRADTLLIEEFIRTVVNESDLKMQAMIRLIKMASLDCEIFKDLHKSNCLWMTKTTHGPSSGQRQKQKLLSNKTKTQQTDV